jgi:hypothetical protein
VPLLIKAPRQGEGSIDERNLRSPDLLPTIADHLGVSIPWRIDGTSMRRAEADRGPVKRNRDHSISLDDAWELLRRESFTLPHSSRTPAEHPYPFGPRPDLLGMLVSELPVGAPAEGVARLDLPNAFSERVDAVDGPLPALVSGVVGGGFPDDGVVVVAVNGRVAGVSPVFRDLNSAPRFATLVPDAYFRGGRNRLRLFQLQGDVLRPLTPSPT